MSLFPKPLSIIRTSRAYNQNTGKFDRTESTLTLTGANGGSVQPLTGEEILSLEPGRRDKGQVWIFTRSTLVTPLEAANTAPDKLLWNGKLWEVVHRDAWDNGLIPHNRYRAEEVKA